MPGWHYVLELWEKGQVWDVTDKAYPMYFTDDSGQRKLNPTHEWQNANTVEVAELIGKLIPTLHQIGSAIRAKTNRENSPSGTKLSMNFDSKKR